MRVRFLTDQWREMFLREAEGVPGLPGATGSFEVAVTRPNGTTGVFRIALAEGAVADVSLGPSPAEADLRVELPEADVVDLFAGNMDPVYKAYWTGRMRAIGDMAITAAIAPLLDTDGFRGLLRRVLELTDFS